MPPLSMVDPTYKVAMDARPSNYEVTHISWERPASNLNWFRYVVVRSPNGYPQSPDDGTIIFPDPGNAGWATSSYKNIGVTDDVILRVTGVDVGGVVQSSGISVISIGSAVGVAMTNVSPVSVDNLKGKNLLVDVTTGGAAYPALSNEGGNYAVGDYLRIPGNSLKDPTGVSTATLPGVTSTTQLGVTNTYHLYDNSSTYATTANPGVTAGTNPYSKQYNKYYYSLFAYVAPINSTTAASVSTLINVKGDAHYSDFTWIKLGEASSVVVHQNTTRSTKDVLLDHIPAFYSGKNNFNQNKDLSDFLSLFAFHLDVYLAETKAVFNMADAETTDEVLLEQFLKQFGSELNQISDVIQARKVLANIVRDYSLGGSTLGLKNLIESYTGNAVKQYQPLNLLPDYNTSSFVESIGSWYPTATTGTSYSYDPSYPYDYTLDPIIAATHGTVPTESMVAQLLDASLVGTTNVNISPNASFLGKIAYTTAVVGGAISNNYETLVTTSAITATTSTTIVVNDTSKLKLGAMPLVVSGTGVFSPQTVITYIDKDGVTFKVNIAPSTQISINDQIVISNTITSNSLSLHPANTTTSGTISFYNGIRQGYTATSSTVSTNAHQYISAIKPNIVRVGDYVSGHLAIPDGTKVTEIGSTSTAAIKIGNKLTGTVPANTLLYFSSKPSTALGAAVDMIPVSPSTPYAFGIHHNANSTATNAGKTTSVSLTWFDINGTIISTTTATSSAVSTTSPFTNSDAGKTWYPTYTQDISPSNASYVSPGFSVLSASDASRYCIDSAMLVKPVNIIKKARSGGVATLTTDVPHNFWYSATLGSGLVAVTVSDDSSFNTTNAAITEVVQNNLGTYTFSYTNAGSDVTATTTTGYAASFPMIDATIGGKTMLLSAFQDARDTTLEVIADRVNLVLNPSFDNDTSTPYDWGVYGSGTVTLVTQSSGDLAHTGTKYLKPAKSATSPGYSIGIAQTAPMAVVAGKTYTASTYVKPIAGAPGSPSVKIGIQWGTDTSPIGLGPVYGTPSSTLGGGDYWSRITTTQVAPAGATRAYLVIVSATTYTTALSYGVDGVLFEEANSALTYFNGDFDGFNYLSTRDSMWEGSPGQSRSHLYRNRVLNRDNIDTLAVKGINYA